MSIAVPPLSWVDIHSEVPNNIVNIDDVFQFILAFKGDPYPFNEPPLVSVTAKRSRKPSSVV